MKVQSLTVSGLVSCRISPISHHLMNLLKPEWLLFYYARCAKMERFRGDRGLEVDLTVGANHGDRLISLIFSPAGRPLFLLRVTSTVHDRIPSIVLPYYLKCG